MTQQKLDQQRGIVRVWGKGSRSFLDGLLPANVADLSPQSAVWTALLTPTGTVLAVFHLVAVHDSEFWLDCAADRALALGKSLSRYRLGHQVGLDMKNDVRVRLLDNPSNKTPSRATTDSFSESPAITVVDSRHPMLPHRAYIANSSTIASDIDHTSQYLALGVTVDAAVIWERDLPQSLGMRESQGLVLERGCFVGQEVVVRVAHRQKLRKALYPVRFHKESRQSEKNPVILRDAQHKRVAELRYVSGTLGLAMTTQRILKVGEVVDVTPDDESNPGQISVPSWHQHMR